MKGPVQWDLEDVPGAHEATPPGISNLGGREDLLGQEHGIVLDRNPHHGDGKRSNDLKKTTSVVRG